MNGIYNMQTSHLNFSDEFDAEIVFFGRIPIKYKKMDADGLEYMQDVKCSFF